MTKKFTLKPDDQVVHVKYGTGIVLDIIDNRAVIKFKGKGTLRRTLKWVKENCVIISAEALDDVEEPEEQDEFEEDYSDDYLSWDLDMYDPFEDFIYIEPNAGIVHSEHPKLRPTRVIVIETYPDRFRRYGYDLSQSAIWTIEEFLRYRATYLENRRSSAVNAVRCNMLVEHDGSADPEEIMELVKYSLCDRWNDNEMTPFCLPAEKVSELSEGFPFTVNQLAFIYGFTAPLNEEHWDGLLKQAARFPEKQLVIIGNTDFIRAIDENPKYRHFFNYRLTVGRKTEEISKTRQLTNEVIARLTAAGRDCTEAFIKDIEDYVKAAYADTSLSDEEFVDETVNSTLIKYHLLLPDPRVHVDNDDDYVQAEDIVIDINCVPDFNDAKSVLEKLDRMLGVEKVKELLWDIYHHRESGDLVQPLNFVLVSNSGRGQEEIAEVIGRLLRSLNLVQSYKSWDFNPKYEYDMMHLFRTELDENAADIVMMGKDAYKIAADFPKFKFNYPYVIELDDYTNNELLEIFLTQCERERMTLSEDKLSLEGTEYTARELLFRKFNEERCSRFFYNELNVRVIYNRLKQLWLTKGDSRRVFTPELIHECLPETKGVDLKKMVGMEKVKEELDRITDTIAYINYLKNNGHDISSTRLHMLFTGNPGTGKTTIAKKLADFLYEKGVINTPKLVVKERKDLVAGYIGQTAKKTEEAIQEAMDGVLFIDEAYSLIPEDPGRDFGQEAIATLLTAMEEYRDRLIIIFAGYKDEMRRFTDSNPGILSRIGFVLNFPDYTSQQLTEMFVKKMTDERGSRLVLEPGAADNVKELMDYFAGSQNFGNGRFVDKVIERTLARRSQREYMDKQPETISAADIPSIGDMLGDAGMTVSELTEEDILWPDNVKKCIDEFRMRVQYFRELRNKTDKLPEQNLHMCFEGNPGTGKTMIARMIADILYKNNVLKTNNLVSVERKDLIGRHIGETAIKTADVIKKAMDGVLFVDEAYSLAVGSENDFGQEAIATLITAMEEHKNRLVVIFAGYREEMKKFRAMNPGLNSRIGCTIQFEDYTAEQLVEIFRKKMNRSGFLLEEGVAEQVGKRAEYFRHLPGFGNGRFIDKIIDLLLSRRAQRYFRELSENGPLSDDKLKTFTLEDVPTEEEIIAIIPDSESMATDSEQSEEERKKTACHEVGHALVGRILDSKRKLKVITMNANAVSLGHVEYEPYKNVNQTEEEMKASLAMFFGGRNAERLIYGQHSTGCISDMKKAKKMAKQMIEVFAMGEIGVTTETDLLREADEAATKVLTQHRDLLNKMVDILMESGTLTGQQLEEELAKRKP